MENTDVEFHELLIVLCLINETYNGLSFEEQQARREGPNYSVLVSASARS